MYWTAKCQLAVGLVSPSLTSFSVYCIPVVEQDSRCLCSGIDLDQEDQKLEHIRCCSSQNVASSELRTNDSHHLERRLLFLVLGMVLMNQDESPILFLGLVVEADVLLLTLDWLVSWSGLQLLTPRVKKLEWDWFHCHLIITYLSLSFINNNV